MQIITHFHGFLVKRMLCSANALIYDNRIGYFCIIVELSNVVNENDAACTVTQKLHGGVKMTPIGYNGAPKWHTKQYYQTIYQTYIFLGDNASMTLTFGNSPFSGVNFCVKVCHGSNGNLLDANH